MKIKEIILGIAIAIIFLMFCVFGAKLIYDAPKYENYCDYSKINAMPIDKNLSEAEIQAQQEAQQQLYEFCSNAYDLANEYYSKNMFIIALIFGVWVIAFSTIFINTNSISGGLMFGSLMFIVYGTGRYWNYMDDILRFVILGVALGVLIYVAYLTGKRMGKSNKNKKPKKR